MIAIKARATRPISIAPFRNQAANHFQSATCNFSAMYEPRQRLTSDHDDSVDDGVNEFRMDPVSQVNQEIFYALSNSSEVSLSSSFTTGVLRAIASITWEPCAGKSVRFDSPSVP